MPKKFGPLVIFSWGWDLKLPFGYWLTYSHVDGKRGYVSLDGTPGTKVLSFRLPWRY